MAYKLVDFDKKRKELEVKLRQDKKADDYDRHGFDEDVTRELTALVRAAVEIEEDVHNRIGTASGTAKRLMDKMETLGKKGKKITPADANLINVMTKTIEDNWAEAENASSEASAVLGQWRGDFTKYWNDLFSDEKVPAGITDPRAPTLKYGPADEVLRKRMKEYVERAKNIQQLAKQASSTGGPGDNLAGDTKKFSDAVAKHQREISKLATEVSQGLKLMVLTPIEQDKKIKARPDRLKVKTWEDALAGAEAKAKPIRGQFKSLEVLMATYKKSAAMLQGEAKKAAVKAYDDAAKLYKLAQTSMKTLASDQDKGKKAVVFAKKNIKK